METRLPVGSQVVLSHEQCGKVLGIVKWNAPKEVGLELNPGVARLLSRFGLGLDDGRGFHMPVM